MGKFEGILPSKFAFLKRWRKNYYANDYAVIK